MVLMILMILMILLLACEPASAANCACSAGGSSYNFLGDPSMDIDMDSYDEFVSSHYQAASVQAAETDAPSRLILDLSDHSRVNLNLTQTAGKFSGQGSMILANANETAPLQASGSLQGSRLDLELATAGGAQYRFNLAKEGSAVMGNYSRIEPDGSKQSGIAQGKWEN